MRSAVVALALAGVAASCGGESTTRPGPTGPTVPAPAVTSGTALERFFPLVDGHVYHWVTENDAGRGLLQARVVRTEASRGELRFPAGSRRFEYAPDGIVATTATGRGYVLKAPLAVGSTWTGEHGGTTRVLLVDAIVEVPAGKFTGCIQTIEERRGDRPVKYATTFCPDVGIAVLEAADGQSIERAELKSFGPPVSIGQDGVQKWQVPVQ